MEVFLSFLLCIGVSTLASGRVSTKESQVKLTWTKASEIEVVLANGTRDRIHLQTVADHEGKDIPCLYTGSLDHDSEDSEVTVNGCKGDKKVLVEIASHNEVGGLLVLVIQNEKTYKLQQEDKHWMGNDYLEIPSEFSNSINFEASLASSRRIRLPGSVTVETSLRYDNSLLAYYNYNHEKVKDVLERVVEFTKPLLNLLNVKVNLRVTGIQHYDRNIIADNTTIYSIRQELNGENLKGPISYFCKQDTRSGTAGIAFEGSACDTRTGYQININEVQILWDDFEDVLQTSAEVFAHELGHNIGMKHDFDPSHGGDDTTLSKNFCNGKGLMSYYNFPRTWSNCSNSDFAKWFQAEGHQCLNEKSPASNIVKSPNYPENYDNNKHVNFPLEVASGSIIELSFTDFDIEPHTNCSYDYVQVLDTDNSELLKKCGRRKPEKILKSKGNKMSVVFHSDDSVVRKGFSATWRAVEVASKPVSGEITSPNYPENYPHNLKRKEYEIVVAVGNRVELTFEDLAIEPSGSDCPYDNLKAYDTPAAGSPTLIAGVCGTMDNMIKLGPWTGGPWVSMSNIMTVYFTSDNSMNFKGFKAKWKQID